MRANLRRAIAAAGVAATTAALLAATPGAASARPEESGAKAPGTPTVEVEIPGPEFGKTAGSGHTEVPAGSTDTKPAAPLSPAAAALDGTVTKLINHGRTSDRLDVVIIGDGYTASQLGTFHTQAKAKWANITAVEPYKTYKNLFNVWTVDAVSHDSGVSGDPSKGVHRNTALGSYFWCDDIERLLCVDQTKVDKYVAKAPDADLVIVLSNSKKYGGAGYNQRSARYGYEGISTASAGNEQSGQVAIHETGHSLGKLADEYDYPYDRYTGPEPGDSNISKLTAAQLKANRAKWYRWIGEKSPDGGRVGSFEGAGYYVHGLYRPTDNSLMRILGVPFNLPGVESMIGGFYRHARIATPGTRTDLTLRTGATAKVTVPTIYTANGRKLKVRWFVDGKEVTRLAGRTAVKVTDVKAELADRAVHKLTVRVEDRTPSVRDPKVAKTLRTSVNWKVRL
ncbi:M64 family metallopeptidase [Streptomyces sp. NRRL S-87]|uniref:M64 family metallopeptidase n=1 Tax=Streptomyces sp. NRRL S-87 TaxID=1463920 RepID=UPI0004C022F2|nr:M64 family metallopeptidase [Streptomyces sp. NRRL S-87]